MTVPNGWLPVVETTKHLSKLYESDIDHEVRPSIINGIELDINGHHNYSPPNFQPVSGETFGDTDVSDEVLSDTEPDNQVPIAICGMAVRLPAGLNHPQKLWNYLLAKGDARSKVPESRYNVSAFYDPSGKPGTVITEHGYFLDENIDRLDTTFFSMTRTEVEKLDPQQRLMLEVARECLEDAGVTDYRGKNTGCYIGSLGEDWCEMFARESQNWGNYRITGHGDFALSNRVSYEMDLRGPSMTIRTACSASLVALHEACVAISRGDCDSAVVGGANLIMSPGATMSMTEQNVLSPDGSCKSFSADANGYARGEAITAIYIKRLDDAIKDNDPIRAVIRGTATNHDGKTPRLTVPSSEAQAKLIRRAYQSAGIADFSKTAFVECHGTGTIVGDPIEAKAIGEIFGKQGVFIGSIKPNFGHTEGSSGILSVIKAVLSLENRTIPPNIKLSKPNPAIPFEKAKLTVPIEPTPWPRDRSARASVNSFGIGGTNAHVVIDAGPKSNIPIPMMGSTKEPHLLLMSANTQQSLSRMAENYQGFFEDHPECAQDLAYTLAIRREHLAHRTFAVVTKGNLGTVEPAIKASKGCSVIMVFTGQGAQWPQMGRELLDSNQTFLKSIRRLDMILQSMTAYAPQWKIEEELRKSGKESRMDSAELAQPLCAAIQIALVDTFASLGVHPSAVVGHSSGEIAAAYAAGALSAEEAIQNALYRGALTDGQKRLGAMAAVGMGWEQTEKYLLPNTSIACDNSPSSVTISGDLNAVDATVKNIRSQEPGILTRKLRIDKAYHSYHMSDIGEKYRTTIEKLTVEREPKTLFFSSVSGGLLQGSSLGARYWQKNLESPVLFKSAISSILKHPVCKNAVFLEIGPHSALAGPLRQTLVHESNTTPYISAMVRNQNCTESLLVAAGRLHQRQVPINFRELMRNATCLSDLPPYPWDHEEIYWYESRLSLEYRQRKYPQHDLLGSRIQEATELEPSWRNMLHLDSAAWLRDHKVGDDIIFPFAGYITMAGEAARQLSGIEQAYRLRHIVVSTALVINEGHPTEVITTLRRQRLTDTLDGEWWEFNITSYNGRMWIKHCTGLVMAQTERPDATMVPQSFPRKVDARRWFNTLKQAGLDLGTTFRNLGKVSSDTTSERAAAEVFNTDQVSFGSKAYHLHPTVIDSALQLVGIAFAKGESRKHQNRLPVSCDDICVSRSSSTLTANATTRYTGGSVIGDVEAVAEGLSFLKLSGLRLSAVDNPASSESNEMPSTARLNWTPDLDFIDLKTLISPSIDPSAQMPKLDELAALCIVKSQRTLENKTIHRPHLRKFHQWINDQINAQSLVLLKDLDDAELTNRMEEIVQLLANTNEGSAAVALQKVCGQISGLVESDFSSWEDILSQDAVFKFYDFVDQCDYSNMLRKLAYCKPNLRVLEIGSWRSTPSEHIMQTLTLPDRSTLWSKYTFTSKSYMPSQKDQNKLANIEYMNLDIDMDPFEQGFEDRRYDLVIARNAVHLSRSIGQSLKNIRKILDPNGHLLLQELCPTSKWINFVLGTNPSWWCGAADGRHAEPYVDTNRWQSELVDAGYAKAKATILDANEPWQLNATIIAQPAIEEFPAKRVTVFCSDTTRDTDLVLEALQFKGYDIVKCTIQDHPPPNQDIVALLDMDTPFFEDLDSGSFEAFKAFLQHLDGSGILWVTKPSQMQCNDPKYAQTIGLARTIRSELLIDFATCEVDDFNTSAALFVEILAKFQMRGQSDLLKPDFEYAISGGVVHVGRYFPFALSEELLHSEDSDRLVLDVEIPGRISTLHWTRKPALPSLEPDEVEVDVHSVGLNFRDVLVAMKIIEFPKRVIGIEAAGVVRRVGSKVQNLRPGDHVAMVDRGVFSTRVVTLEILCAKIPTEWDFDKASVMFFPYATAMHSLMFVGGLQKGQSALIHSACGGVGLAAVQLAQMLGAEVYVTVGTEEKVQYIMETFGIARNRIFSSRDDSFLSGILRETYDEGVDIVLNSLSGELLHASWKCVAPFGKLVEIGKRDLMGFGKLDLNPFLANRSYCCVDLDAFRERPVLFQRLLKSISELYEQGKIQIPGPVRVFDAASTYDAFRYMQTGQHIGRICVSIREHSDIADLGAKVLSRPRTLELQDSASYLLVGGLGGLGRAVSTWMVEHGARHLLFLSRNAGKTPQDEQFVKELNSMGCEAQLVLGSVTNLDDVSKALKEAKYPVKGILQMSMVLRDESFSKMTHQQWNEACAPKVQGTWNLHNASISEGLDLDFLVLMSSLSGTIGNPGQANYASANTFLDAFVQYRNNNNLPASSVDIGAIKDVGYISENPALMQKMEASGFKALKEQEVLNALEVAMTPTAKRNFPPSASSFVDKNSFVLGLASRIPLTSPTNRTIWKNDRRMAIYHNNTNATGTDITSSTATLKTYINTVKSDLSLLESDDAAHFFALEIGKRLFQLLMQPEEDLNTALSLADLGLDSLVGTELASWWKQMFGFRTSVLEMLGKGTLEALGGFAVEGLVKVVRGEREAEAEAEGK